MVFFYIRGVPFFSFKDPNLLFFFSVQNENIVVIVPVVQDIVLYCIELNDCAKKKLIRLQSHIFT